ncbi:hypothetical protein [Novosphingobium guangzhouense]|nr:hypothetical protein [Novosphingobium guangzhouense]
MENEQAPSVHSVSTAVPEAFAWAPDMVIYHDKCADGIVAAWACWKRWGEAPEYRAANYGYQPPEDVAGKNILIVDFSYKADDLRAMVAAGAKSIVILDHHETAQAALEPFSVFSTKPERFSTRTAASMIEDLERGGYPAILALFDMDRSGARMAWDFAMQGVEPPELVLLAERYDLWRFVPNTLDDAELLHLDIQSGPLTIERMESIHDELQDGERTPLNRGEVVEYWRQPLIREIAARAYLGTVGGVEGVIMVECPYSLVSAVGHYLLAQHPAAPFAAMSVTGEKAVSWSLRSAYDRQSVSEVASRFGGGGHRNAAGFRVETNSRDARVAKYLSDESAARAAMANRPAEIRDRLNAWQTAQSEWFSDTLLEIVAEFIAFEDAKRETV